MENEKEKQMENEMDAGASVGLIACVWLAGNQGKEKTTWKLPSGV